MRCSLIFFAVLRCSGSPHVPLPNHYDVTVRVGLKKFKFNGHVSILINVTNPTEYVLLHANELLVTLVSAQTIKGSEYDLVLSEMRASAK